MNDIAIFALGLGAGILAGVGIAWLFRMLYLKTGRELADELHRAQEADSRRQIDEVIGQVRESFKGMSLDALSQSTGEFLKLAKQTIDAGREQTTSDLSEKKGLIDQQLTVMTAELTKVSALVNTLEKDREQKFGELTGQLQATGRQTAELMRITDSLTRALASSKTRGQWGERMAEDVLRMAGFLERVHYVKQQAIEGHGSIPDFTFILPRDLRLNMDVKFPYDNYVRFLDAESESDREGFRRQFLADVKLKIKEVSTRNYINPEQNTVDYVLMFIPNEQIYAFINEQDPSILDDGIRKKVVICSPVTLFAVLAVIRQAVDNFTFEQTSRDILKLLGQFNRQWEKFTDALRKLGQRIESAHDEYNVLISTRKNQLERPLQKIEDMRLQKGLALPGGEQPDADETPE